MGNTETGEEMSSRFASTQKAVECYRKANEDLSETVHVSLPPTTG